MLRTHIEKVVSGKDLSPDEAKHAMDIIMSGQASDIQISAFLTALRMKGESVDELTGFAISMRANSVKLYPKVSGLVDTCGTGGDSIKTFNVSTTSIFVLAGGDVPVAKHANRGVTSRVGSVDVLEGLGINVEIRPAEVERVIEDVGVGLMFAPMFHPAMKYVMPVRKGLQMRTVFNILGPMTNPAGARRQVIGVFSDELLRKVAYTLENLGTEHSFVVYGDGMDEVTTIGKTSVFEVTDEVREYTLTPKDFGVAPATYEQLRVENTEAETVFQILSGETGPKRDIVLANSSLGFIAGGKASSITEGMEQGSESIDSGMAMKKLKDMITATKGDLSTVESLER